jgi:hypothetical protein
MLWEQQQAAADETQAFFSSSEGTLTADMALQHLATTALSSNYSLAQCAPGHEGIACGRQVRWPSLNTRPPPVLTVLTWQ